MTQAIVRVYDTYTTAAYDEPPMQTDIIEQTADFDYATVDHDWLAEQIGKATMRAVNRARGRGLGLRELEWHVWFYFGAKS